MISEIFVATNNDGKIERYKKLIENAGLKIKIYSPKDFNLEDIDVEETGNSLAENAELKARGYFGKVSLPILANDTGFYVEGEGLVETPKRIALGGVDGKSLSKEEISEKMVGFWKDIATKYGGRVPAAWIEEFVLLYPDGVLKSSRSKREVVLTNTIFGNAHLQMPVRALYISNATNKPSILHTEEEEMLELKPIIDAIYTLLA